MSVRRIVPHVASERPQEVAEFYRMAFGLTQLMDMGWIVTLGAGEGPAQLSLTQQGGGDAPIPHLTLEVDDFEATLARLDQMGIDHLYGPVVEPWGVRRVMVADPEGTILNVMEHQTSA